MSKNEDDILKHITSNIKIKSNNVLKSIGDDCAVIKVNSKNAIGNIFNIGLGKPKKVKSVIKNIRSIINSGQPQFGKIKMRKDEIKSIYPNINKAKKILKWQPKIEFRKGLIKTIKYYSKNANK